MEFVYDKRNPSVPTAYSRLAALHTQCEILLPGLDEAAARTVGAAGDGSVELMHAFCLAVITGRQPEGIVEEAYWSTLLALAGDHATHIAGRVDIPSEMGAEVSFL